MQYPLATLLLDEFDVTLKGSEIDLVIVSGLDAMGRVSDNEKLIQLFQDLAGLQNIPESLLPIFKFVETVKLLANGRDVDVDKIIKTAEEQAKDAQANKEATSAAMAEEAMLNKASPEQLAEGISQTET